MLPWLPSFSISRPLVRPYLLAISFVVALQLPQRIPAKLLDYQPSHRQRHHSLGSDTRCRHHAHIAAFIRSLYWLARRKAHRRERPPQGRNRLQITAHHHVLTVRDAALNPARVIVLPRELREVAVLPVAGGLVSNRVMHGGPEG